MSFPNSLFRLNSLTTTNYFKCRSRNYATINGNISTVGFIGLGAMGRHMAKHMIKKFKNVSVYDIDESAASTLAKEGATVAKHLDELTGSDCIISMIATNQQVLDVYQPPSGLISKVKPGTLIVDCSTVDPLVPQKLAVKAHNNNVTFVDAPVSGDKPREPSGRAFKEAKEELKQAKENYSNREKSCL